MTKTELAQALYDEFSELTINDGTKRWVLKDVNYGDEGPKAWMAEVVRELHGDMLPDDTKYAMIRECSGKLTEYDEDQWEDSVNEMADGMVDIYNMERVRWLASHLGRAGYCDDALEEGLADKAEGIFGIIGVGQLLEYEEILNGLIQAIEAKFYEQE